MTLPGGPSPVRTAAQGGTEPLQNDRQRHRPGRHRPGPPNPAHTAQNQLPGLAGDHRRPPDRLPPAGAQADRRRLAPTRQAARAGTHTGTTSTRAPTAASRQHRRPDRRRHRRAPPAAHHLGLDPLARPRWALTGVQRRPDRSARQRPCVRSGGARRPWEAVVRLAGRLCPSRSGCTIRLTGERCVGSILVRVFYMVRRVPAWPS
jgi:hypothetical protein